MMHTDYSKIAQVYDANRIRHSIERDPLIGEIADERSGSAAGAGAGSDRRIAVLDLACGTGNYLSSQVPAYSHLSVRWIGIDKSTEMLAKAKAKKLDAELLEGSAEDIPLESASVDYVITRFAFRTPRKTWLVFLGAFVNPYRIYTYNKVDL